MIPQNKKADISITILVVGIMLICSIALFSFFSSTIKVRNSFEGIGLVEQLNSQIEENSFYKREVGISDNYLEKRETKGILFWQKKVLSFSVEYKGKP